MKIDWSSICFQEKRREVSKFRTRFILKREDRQNIPSFLVVKQIQAAKPGSAGTAAPQPRTNTSLDLS